MNGGFKDIILEDVYDEWCDRYDYAACPPANKQQNKAAADRGAASSPAKRQPAAPKPPTPPAAPKPKAKKPACGSQPQTAQTYGEQCPPGMYFCTDAKKCKPVPEGKALTDSGWLVDMSESEFDFARCQRPDGSYYGTAGQCRKGTLVSNAEEAQIQSALKELKSYKAGYQKTGGDNLQDPGEAAKYASFYEKDKDLSYKASKETRPEVVKEVLARLKEEDQGQYIAVMKSLNSKGSPEKTMRAEAGWTGSERGEAVLKSLMDNDFKDVLGNPAPWGQGLQLDHRTAGSVGGKDRPSNWIWISTATNQTKGGYEAAAKKVKGTGAEKEAFIKASLIKGLQGNAKMTPAQVKEVKAKGAATVAAKAEGAAKARKILPAMTPTQRGELISRSSGPQMKEILKASVAEGKNPATGRPTSYRPVLSGGNGARVRKDYGTVPQMKSLAKMRWDEPLSKSDLGNIGGILKASTGSTKSRSERLDELMGNFPRTSGLTAAERIAILGAAE